MASRRWSVSPISFAEILNASSSQLLLQEELTLFQTNFPAAPMPQNNSSTNGQQTMSYAQVAAAAAANQSTVHKDEEWEDCSSLLQDEGAAAVSKVENYESDEVIAMMLQLELDQEQEETAKIMSGMQNSDIDEAIAASLVRQEETDEISRSYRYCIDEAIARSLQMQPEGNQSIEKWQRMQNKGRKAKGSKPKKSS